MLACCASPTAPALHAPSNRKRHRVPRPAPAASGPASSCCSAGPAPGARRAAAGAAQRRPRTLAPWLAPLPNPSTPRQPRPAKYQEEPSPHAGPPAQPRPRAAPAPAPAGGPEAMQGLGRLFGGGAAAPPPPAASGQDRLVNYLVSQRRPRPRAIGGVCVRACAGLLACVCVAPRPHPNPFGTPPPSTPKPCPQIASELVKTRRVEDALRE